MWNVVFTDDFPFCTRHYAYCAIRTANKKMDKSNL